MPRFKIQIFYHELRDVLCSSLRLLVGCRIPSHFLGGAHNDRDITEHIKQYPPLIWFVA